MEILSESKKEKISIVRSKLADGYNYYLTLQILNGNNVFIVSDRYKQTESIYSKKEAIKTAKKALQDQNETKYFDLFENYNLQPPKLAAVVSKYSFDQFNIEQVKKFYNEVVAIGYRFCCDVDLVPFGLRPLNIDLYQLEGWKK